MGEESKEEKGNFPASLILEEEDENGDIWLGIRGRCTIILLLL